MIDFRVILFFVIIVLGFVFMGQPGRKGVKTYIILILSLLVLESCLRGISIGSDTWKYKSIFDDVGNMSWKECYDSVVSRYLHHEDDSDAGYVIFQKIIHLFSHNFNFFLFACALCFFIPFGKLLMKFDWDIRDLMFLFIFYVALFNPIAMSGTRKEIALGLSILCLLNYYDKRYTRAVIWLVLGVSIHLSMLAILLIPALNLLKPKQLKTVHFLSFFTIPVAAIFSTSIIAAMANFVENEHYLDYAQVQADGGGMTFVIMMELLLLVCFLFIKKGDLENNTLLKLFYSALPMATFFVPLITNNGSMIRLSQYFHLYALLLIPYIVKTYLVSNKRAIYFVLSLILIVMCMQASSQVSDYYFFWNDPQQHLN